MRRSPPPSTLFPYTTLFRSPPKISAASGSSVGSSSLPVKMLTPGNSNGRTASSVTNGDKMATARTEVRVAQPRGKSKLGTVRLLWADVALVFHPFGLGAQPGKLVCPIFRKYHIRSEEHTSELQSL